MTERKVPPLGVAVRTDIRQRGVTHRARARWTDPETHRREDVSESFDSPDAAQAWLDDKKLAARTGVDPGQTLREYVDALGDRWSRSIDPTPWILTRPDCGSGSFRRWDTFRSAC